MIRVCALSNRLNGPDLNRYIALEKSLIRKDMRFFHYMESLPWRWLRTVEWELEVCRAHPKDHFIFIDTFDYLFVGERSEVASILLKQDMLFSCDAGDKPYPATILPSFYDERQPYERDAPPWVPKHRWINGVGPSGKGEAICDAIRYGQTHFEIYDNETDQTFWTNVYLDGWGVADTTCELTQTLMHADEKDLWIKDGRYYNSDTGKYPQFIHASGRTWNHIPKELVPGPQVVTPPLTYPQWLG